MTSDDLFLNEATAIGDRLCDDAVWHRDACTWLAREIPDPLEARERDIPPRILNIPSNLYSGTAGVGLFLARLHSYTDDPRHRETARGALNQALTNAWRLTRDLTEEVDFVRRFGFYAGTFGIAWAAYAASRRLHDGSLEDWARRVYGDLAGTADKPHDYDVLLGASGAIPALLEMEHHDFPGATDLAVALGHGLVQRAQVDGDRAAWRNDWDGGESRPLCGFSHGAAGAGWALTRLYGATKNEAFRDTALAAFRYERAAMDPEERNWPNFNAPPDASGKHLCQTNWCHGAPGVGVSRALSHSILGENDALQDLRIARETTEGHLRRQLESPGWSFVPCHGVGGNAECLWIMGGALASDGGPTLAREVGRYGAERFGALAAERWGHDVEWPTDVPAGVQPSLMVGIAGIGHFFLRLHDPRGVPTMLAPGGIAD